ncbi:MAG: hypothetical protein P9L91_08980, partial [Candidatus Zophobacter franzmannii]|nr:hypothetical protein [Candidatus Zophobacter franzmannii]
DYLYRNSDVKVKKPMSIDIVLINKVDRKEQIPIELKYKTSELTYFDGAEKYHLKPQGAQDIGRFSFRKDIFRTEQFIHNKNKENDIDNCKQGFVLILTNDKRYFNESTSKRHSNNILNQNFSFHPGAIVPKEDLSWNYAGIKDDYKFDKKENRYKKGTKVHWTCRGAHLLRLNLYNEYVVNWEDFSDLSNLETSVNCLFKYCLFSIKR